MTNPAGEKATPEQAKVRESVAEETKRRRRAEAIDSDTANKIYDILVEECGAGEHNRIFFVVAQEQGGCVEYRFQGSLGFGGKFWNSNQWYVTCYGEDYTKERLAAIDRANQRLTVLREANANYGG